MHYPYLSVLENFGLKIELFRISWFTTIFNRVLMKWGINRSKFWSHWFNVGMIITILLFPLSMLLILKTSLDILFKTSDGNEGQVLELVVITQIF